MHNKRQINAPTFDISNSSVSYQPRADDDVNLCEHFMLSADNNARITLYI